MDCKPLALIVLVVIGAPWLALAQGENDDTAPTLLPSCELCLAGTFADKNSSNCTASARCGNVSGTCPWPAPGTVRTFCSKCPEGYYQNATGSSACALCPPGQASVPSLTTCALCESGTVKPEGALRCAPCPAGTQPEDTHVACKDCPDGTYSNADTGSVCLPCAPPLHVVDRSLCTTCPPGQAANTSFVCVPCPPEQEWLPATGGCRACAPGSVCAYTRGPSGLYCDHCKLCSVGKAWNRGNLSCVDCPAGRYQDEEGQQSCKGCQIGYYQSSTGASSCVICPAGYYCPNSISPVQCPPQHYCPEGSTAALTCSSLYDADVSVCRPSVELIVIIAASSVVGLLVLVGGIYVIYLRTRAPPASELLVKPQKDPVYGGL